MEVLALLMSVITSSTMKLPDRTAVGLKFYLVGGGREKILKLDEFGAIDDGGIGIKR